MRYISNHIIFLGRAVAIVIFLASSGFTTILHNCTMVTVACCQTPVEAKHEGCDGSLPSGEMVIQADLTCHSSSMVGGVITNPAVLEKDSKLAFKQLAGSDSILASVVYTTDQTSNTSSDFFTLADPVFLPSVEKYVLNASLLI